LRLAGWRWALLALLLDYFKAALPVGLGWFFWDVQGWQIVPVALAPLVGHAYTPWLRGRGGKAVASTFGAWTGLTVGSAPTILGLLLGAIFLVIETSGWAMLLAFGLFGIFVIRQLSPVHPELTWVWLANLALLALRHRAELARPPRLRRFRKGQDSA
jgi:glycerol-3-phosphate acyltransferase PlsY